MGKAEKSTNNNKFTKFSLDGKTYLIKDGALPEPVGWTKKEQAENIFRNGAYRADFEYLKTKGLVIQEG